MSLMKTLAKAALGIAVAKGVSSMANRAGGGSGGGGLLGGLSGALGGGQQAQAQAPGGQMGGQMGSQSRGGGGIGDMLGSVLSGRQSAPGGMGGRLGSGGGGLGGMLDSLTGGGAGGAGGAGGRGGLEGMLGGLLGGAAAGGAPSGGLGGMLDQLAGRAPRPRGEPEADFGEVLNSSLDPERNDIPPTPEQEAAAGLMLRAMVQAAKADGKLDEGEREKLLGHLDDVTPEERQFVQHELQQPLDPEGLARQVPKGLEPQVYAMSVMAIDLDSREEAQYLDRLAKALGLQHQDVNNVHSQLGVPSLYT